MAGHSKFKNIMYRKGAQDAKRSKIFSKLSKEITVAAKIGGPDLESNPRLRLAVQNARGQSMPKDNIERAIKKADSSDVENFDEIRYEGYGPGGTAVIVEALTDNRNRSAGNIRSYFSKNGGTLGESGSVSFLFDRVGEITFKPEVGDADSVLEQAIEVGADDVESDEDGHTLTCAFEQVGEIANSLEQVLGASESVNVVWKPQNLVEVDVEKAKTILKLLNALEDDDDVQNVYTNFEVSEETVMKLENE